MSGNVRSPRSQSPCPTPSLTDDTTPTMTSSGGPHTPRSSTNDSANSSEMQSLPINPRPFMASLVGKTVRIRLKWCPPEQEYVGRMVSTDGYFNIQIDNAVEYVDGVKSGDLGTCTIRCNNVQWVTEETDDIEPSIALQLKQRAEAEANGTGKKA